MTGGVARAGHLRIPRNAAQLSAKRSTSPLGLLRVGRTSFDFAHRIVRAGATARSPPLARMTDRQPGPGADLPQWIPMVELVRGRRPCPSGSTFPGRTAHRCVVPRVGRAPKRPRQLSTREPGSLRRLHRRHALVRSGGWSRRRAPGSPRWFDGGVHAREAHAGDRVRMETWPTGEGARAYELTRHG